MTAETPATPVGPAGGPTAAPVSLTIDGQPVLARAGQSIWEAAREAGIAIPALCHTPRLRPVGVCRTCVVDVGARTLAASCVRAVEPGMAVQTGTERVERARASLKAGKGVHLEDIAGDA